MRRSFTVMASVFVGFFWPKGSSDHKKTALPWITESSDRAPTSERSLQWVLQAATTPP